MSWHHPLRTVNVRESWRRAKAQFAAIVAERDVLKGELEMLEWENEALKAELANTRSRLRDLVLARRESSSELAALHRERMIDLAHKAEREPGQLLQ